MSDYITLRSAIELRGPSQIAGWNGFERHAPRRTEVVAQRTEILEMSPKAILADAKATHRNLIKRLDPERDLSNQPRTSIDDALGTKYLARTLGRDTPPDLREQFYIGPLAPDLGRIAHIPAAAKLYIWPQHPAEFRAVVMRY